MALIPISELSTTVRRAEASLIAYHYIAATVGRYGFDRERPLTRECASRRSTTALHDRKQDDEMSTGPCRC